MRAVIQRVRSASVTIDGIVNGKIEQGLMLLVGFEDSDTAEDVEWMASKVSKLRVFNDLKGVMNLCITDIGGDILVVSQFTLHAKTKKGNRPSYIMAARPEVAIPLYESFLNLLGKEIQRPIQTGVFGAMMVVSIENDGPVTIIIDTKNKE